MIITILLLSILTFDDLHCLAENVYHESRGESLKGQTYVAAVTINRFLDNRWPRNGEVNSICNVVYDPYQFSWVGRSTPVRDNLSMFRAYQVVINLVYGNEGKYLDPTGGALYYHHKSIKPRWDYGKLQKLEKVGNHVFYKDK